MYRADRRAGAPRPLITAILRGLAVLLTAALLLAPQLNLSRTATEQPIVLFLQDDSQSIPEALGRDTAAFRKGAEELQQRLGRRARVVRWSFGAGVRTDSPFRYREPLTDIAAALSRAQELYGRQHLGAVVLATDGRFNAGLNPLYQSLPLQAPLYTLVLGDTALLTDLRIAAVYANRTVPRGTPFELRADVVATGCEGFNSAVTLTEAGGGGTLGSLPISIPTARYDRSVSFNIPADRPGLHRYILSVSSAPGERNVANNRRDVFVEVVEEKRSILLLAAAPHPDVAALREALAGLEAYTVAVRIGAGAADAAEGADVTILHGLPAAAGGSPRRKPTWYIVSGSTAPAALNAAQSALVVSGSPAAPRDALPGLSTGFTLFTPPVGAAAVVDRLPPLAAPAGLRAGPTASALITERGSAAPLWVLAGGVPPVAVTAGEGLWRWRLYEYKTTGAHRVVDETIRQTVSFLAAGGTDRPFRVDQPKDVWTDGEAVTFNAYLLNASGEAVNTPEATLIILDSAGRRRDFTFDRSGGAYRLSAGVWSAGTYRYTASTTYGGRTYTAGGQFAVGSQPPELMETGADAALLSALSRKYGGSALPWQQTLALADTLDRLPGMKPRLSSRDEAVPLVNWKWYFFLLLIVVGGEWALRKYWGL